MKSITGRLGFVEPMAKSTSRLVFVWGVSAGNEAVSNIQNGLA